MVLSTKCVNLILYALTPSKVRECLLIPYFIYTIMSMTYFYSQLVRFYWKLLWIAS